MCISKPPIRQSACIFRVLTRQVAAGNSRHSLLQPTRGQLSSLVGVPEVLEELGDVVREHVVHRLHHLGLELLELVDAVPTKHLLEVLHVWEVTGGEMVLPLNLLHQVKSGMDVAQNRGEKWQ